MLAFQNVSPHLPDPATIYLLCHYRRLSLNSNFFLLQVALVMVLYYSIRNLFITEICLGKGKGGGS